MSWTIRRIGHITGLLRVHNFGKVRLGPARTPTGVEIRDRRTKQAPLQVSNLPALLPTSFSRCQSKDTQAQSRVFLISLTHKLIAAPSGTVLDACNPRIWYVPSSRSPCTLLISTYGCQKSLQFHGWNYWQHRTLNLGVNELIELSCRLAF